jgi:EF-P beta-lysylation protein EpmB
MADSLSDPSELLGLLRLGPACLGGASAVDAERGFALRLPRGLANRIRPEDPADPILRQVLPVARETDERRGFSKDPVGELRSPPEGGVLRKYRGRALVMVTGACAVHCRYCFRRHFPATEHSVVSSRLHAVTEQLARDRSVGEVILSGGDPLTVPDDRLAKIVTEIAELTHVRRLRIHTRMPVVLPQRVDEGLIEWLAGVPLPTTVVIHANHGNEIDDDVRRSLAALRATGVTLLNQTVLLRGVNDDADALAQLNERLFEVGVLPYYLHMLDRVQGAAHFEVPEDTAFEILRELRARLPGYLVPRLVREVEGAPFKIPVDPKR